MLARRPHWKEQLAGTAVVVLASAVRTPRTRGPLLELLGPYVFSLAMREYLRSERPEFERAMVITAVAPALALLFFFASLPWWLLTGGGPVRWLGLDRFRVRVQPGLANGPLREYMRSERYAEELRRLAPEA